MPAGKPSIWTTAKKWQGNLVPAILSLPFAAGGLYLYRPENPLDLLPIGLLAAFPVVGWFCLNAFGLWGNDQMRAQLGRIYGRERGQKSDQMIFVGYAKPGFRDALDPHQGIGFLIIHPDHLELYGETEQITIPKSVIKGFSLRRNMHSALFLGGWLVIEAGENTLFIEPREKISLRGNRKYRGILKQELEKWKASNQPN